MNSETVSSDVAAPSMAPTSGIMRIEYEPLGKMLKAPRNPKDHDIGEISESMDRFGFTVPALVNEASGRLVAGHGRIDTLSAKRDAGQDPPERITVDEDGEWYLPVVRGVSFENDDEAEAYLIADNRLVERGAWDEALLTAALEHQATNNPQGLGGTGYDENDLQARLEAAAMPEEFPEYDESVGGEVKKVTCPECSHEFIP